MLPGSPPRVRGKAAKQAVLIKAYGITPACAGKRAGCTIARPPSWDHPRVCGEKYLYIRPQVARIGSPPRVRGKVFINSRQSPCHKDHPRVCGEKTVYDFAYAEKGGSPPRVRGKAGGQSSALNAPGITPACAGKSAFPLRSVRSCKDHPRVCGEKKAAVTTLFWTGGSPPRVRGKDIPALFGPSEKRITPACAGKSCPPRPRRCGVWDHPRVCGEKSKIRRDRKRGLGSPPRVRGKG